MIRLLGLVLLLSFDISHKLGLMFIVVMVKSSSVFETTFFEREIIKNYHEESEAYNWLINTKLLYLFGGIIGALLNILVTHFYFLRMSFIVASCLSFILLIILVSYTKLASLETSQILDHDFNS